MDFEVIVGTYEHFLVGYHVEEKTLKDGRTVSSGGRNLCVQM